MTFMVVFPYSSFCAVAEEPPAIDRTGIGFMQEILSMIGEAPSICSCIVLCIFHKPSKCSIFALDMLLETSEVNIQFVQMLQKSSKWCTCCHLGKGIDIFGETLATITKLAIRTRDIGVGVVNIT